MEDNRENLLKAACFLGGVVVGFLLSPIKKGVYLGNNCGNTTLPNKDDVEESTEENLDEEIEDAVEGNLEEEK